MNMRNRKLVRTIQIIYGLYLLFIVISGFLQLIPPPQFNEKGMGFLGALFSTGYMVPLMQIIFLMAGLFFIFNKWSAFGAVILAPITVNILLFHIFLDATGFWSAIIMAALNLYLLAVHWPAYKPMFSK